MNRCIRYYLLSCAIFCGLSVNKPAVGQQQSHTRYRTGDNVAFIGNSITQSGWYQHFIQLFYLMRYPVDTISFYNCGVGGDVAGSILNRLEEDVFVYHPTHITLMVGMNDVGRDLYQRGHVENRDIMRLRKEALNRYARNTEELVKRLTTYTPNVTLIKPSIYDETAKLDEKSCVGLNSALNWCGIHLGYLSQKYHTRITDFWTIMSTINESEQKKNKRFTLVGKDRIHPGRAGHFVMAYQFLKDQGVEGYVSKIAINLENQREKIAIVNCDIVDFVQSDSLVSFSCREKSLPYPFSQSTREALKYVPFVEDFNQQLLILQGLDSGKYRLIIDNQILGEYTDIQLSKGINLAELENSPQNRQAQAVRIEALKLKAIQSKLRSLKRAEYRDLPRDMWGMPIDSLDDYFKTILQSKYADRKEFAKRLFDNYRKYKPREQELMEALKRKENDIYSLNVPRRRAFIIQMKP